MKKLFTKGSFITMTDQAIDWLLIEDDKIIDLGQGALPKHDLLIDLKGKVMMPGFINAHMHPLPTGMEGTTVPLMECETLESVLKAIEGLCQDNEENLILAEGFLSMIIDFDDAAFNALNALSQSHPIAVKYITGHGMVVNQKVMDLLNLETYFIGSDEDMARVNNLFSDDKVMGFIDKVSDEAVANGFTTLHGLIYGDLSDNRDVSTWVKEEKNPGQLKVQVKNFVQSMDVDYVHGLGLNRIGGCICLDGTPIEGSAAFEAPYEDGHVAPLYMSDEKLFDMVAKAHQMDMQCTFHTVGDKAVHQLIDCYQKVVDLYGEKPLRHRLEHVDLISDEKLKKASALGLVFSVQPAIGYLYGEGFEEIIGLERVKKLNSLKRYQEAGIVLAGGTDSPVTPLNGLLGIHSAVYAREPLGRLSRKEALKMYTLGSAYAGHEEDLKGSLEIGKQADLIILSENPLTFDEIQDIEVLETFVKGVSVYKQ